MKIQLDSIAFCREIRAALKDDKTAVKWLKSFYETLLFEGTIDDGLQSVKAMFVEADGYKANVAYKKIFNAFKRNMDGATDAEIRDAMIARRGAEIEQLEERIERRNALMADAPTREDGEFKSDSGDAGNLESATSAESLPALKAQKHPHGEFHNVMLTDDEYTKWVMSGSDADELIEELSSYLASSGKRYKSHYATLINWRKRKATESMPQPQGFKTAADRDREEIKKIADYYAKRREDNGKEAV